MMSSFLAPVHQGKVLGWYERKHRKWGLFGGKPEQGDDGNIIKTAIRELEEEWLLATGSRLDPREAKDLTRVADFHPEQAVDGGCGKEA